MSKKKKKPIDRDSDGQLNERQRTMQKRKIRQAAKLEAAKRAGKRIRRKDYKQNATK